ncbi:MAG: hypothetical protein Q7S23_04305 [bacterium]|nr:hypothetical protein [bacterium]
MPDFRDLPIPMTILPWTKREGGDDAGYRQVAVAEGADDAPDELMVLNPPHCSPIACYPVYAHGARPKVCPDYGAGLSAAARVLVRQPVFNALHDANYVLRPAGRQLLVLDGFRPATVQAALFSYLFRRLSGGTPPDALPPAEFMTIGLRADDVGSFAAVIPNEQFQATLAALPVWIQEALAATNIPKAAELWLTFRHNLGHQSELQLDTSAPTAHGSGGAVDAILVDTVSGEPTLLGVPFDYARPASDSHPYGPAAMRYFEDEANLGHYRDLVGHDPRLRSFLAEFGVQKVTHDLFGTIRDERRLFYHSMARVGFSHFVLECWHWNAGNERSGNQFRDFPYAGNTCHSLLRNVCAADGKPRTVWSNASAHRLAALM